MVKHPFGIPKALECDVLLCSADVLVGVEIFAGRYDIEEPWEFSHSHYLGLTVTVLSCDMLDRLRLDSHNHCVPTGVRNTWQSGLNSLLDSQVGMQKTR